MLNLNTLIIVLLISAFVLFVLGFFVGPRLNIWVAAGACAIAAILLKVFA